MTERLPVIFRKDKGGEIVAVFPTERGTTDPDTMTCYAHVGQHSSCTVGWYYTTKPAQLPEYQRLLNELRQIYETGEDRVCLAVYSRITPEMVKTRLTKSSNISRGSRSRR
jgi:hypothetical protein